MARPNDQIGPYILIRQLGRGGFGVVWLAERRSALVATQVALKLALDEEPDLDAIAQESQLWAQAGGHPNVLPIIEADIYDGQVVIVSEYAPDGSLEEWLKRHGGSAPSIESAVAMTSGILSGLDHLHSKQIIHRDLKPANILLQKETPRLADFGLARVLRASSHSGGIAGTPGYMAPEVFDGKRSEQSDLWAAGVILYKLLSGRLPFPQKDIGALIGAIMMKEIDPLQSSVPEPLQEVIVRSLEKDPEKRFQSAREMRAALHACLAINARLSAQPAYLPIEPSSQKSETMPTLPRTNKVATDELKRTLQTLEFNLVMTNIRGKIVEKQKGQIWYFVEDLSGVSLDMVSIRGGTFLMGSPEAEKSRGLDEGPQHPVSVPPFYMGRYQVTQAQWRTVALLPKIDRDLNPDPSNFKGENLPVEQVSWEEAMEFCARLSKKTGKFYRLPTEAEWEYACRADTTTPFSFGETITLELANYNGNYPYGSVPKRVCREKTLPVGSLGVPNRFGLYDMHGNVWEWCLDSYQGNYRGAPSDGNIGRENGSRLRVMRGGSWHDIAGFCRSAYRNRNLPIFKNLNVGFRVVMQIN
jgi:formylglycine-generating enzyme required for sulfatase activity